MKPDILANKIITAYNELTSGRILPFQRSSLIRSLEQAGPNITWDFECDISCFLDGKISNNSYQALGIALDLDALYRYEDFACVLKDYDRKPAPCKIRIKDLVAFTIARSERGLYIINGCATSYGNDDLNIPGSKQLLARYIELGLAEGPHARVNLRFYYTMLEGHTSFTIDHKIFDRIIALMDLLARLKECDGLGLFHSLFSRLHPYYNYSNKNYPFALLPAFEAGLLNNNYWRTNIEFIFNLKYNGNVAHELNEAIEAANLIGVMNYENCQTNFEKLKAAINGARVYISGFLINLKNIFELDNEEDKQKRFDDIVSMCFQKDAQLIFKNKLKLFKFIGNYPECLTKKSWSKLLTVSDDIAKQVCTGLKRLEIYQSELINKENFSLMLDEGENADVFADALTLDLNTHEEFATKLGSLKCLKTIFAENKNNLSQAHFDLYQFFKQPHVISLSIIKCILSLSIEDAQWPVKLFSQAEINTSLDSVYTDVEHSVPAHVLAEKYYLTKLHNNIPQAQTAYIPRAGAGESSMSDKAIKKAKSRIERLKLQQPKIDVTNIEQNIRRKLLESVLAELIKDNDNKQDDRVAFLNNHFEALVNKTASEDVVKQTLQYLNSTSSVTQIAWRAYEPIAEVQEWPNLLVEPSKASGADTVFATREAAGQTQGNVSLQLASDTVRNWAALIYSATNESSLKPTIKDELWQDFMFYIAEIYCAHGYASPSCFPGTLSRLGQILNKHPKFVDLSGKEQEINKTIEFVIRNKVQLVINKFLTDETYYLNKDLYGRILLSAIQLYGQNNANDLMSEPNRFKYNLVEISTDGHEIDEDCFIRLVMQQRAKMFQQILGGENTNLFEEVVSEVKTRQGELCCQQDLILYLINKSLCDIPNIVYLPEQLLQYARVEQNSPVVNANARSLSM